MENNGGVDDALKKHKNIGSTSEPVVNVDKSDDEPPPLVERVSAVPYDADSGPDDDHSTNDDYTTQSCPLRYSFCLCQTQIDEICATCEPPPANVASVLVEIMDSIMALISVKQQHPHDTVISFFGSLALLGKAGENHGNPRDDLLVNHHVATIHMLGKLQFQAHPNPMLLVKISH